MKKFLITLILILAAAISAYSQKGLAVAPFFSEEYAKNPNVSMVSMTGKDIEKKGIAKYASISVAKDTDLINSIMRAVSKDGAAANSKEVSYRKGELYFGFYFIGGTGKNRQYLFVVNRRPAGTDKVTVVYIRGDLDSSSVRNLLK